VQHARAERSRDAVVGMALAARAGEAMEHYDRRAGGRAVFGDRERPAVWQANERIDAAGQPGPRKWRA
jgi:hypothetical protein